MFEIITDTDVAYELDKIFKVKDQLDHTAYSRRYDGPSDWIVNREREIYYTCYSNRGGSLESYNLGYDEKPMSATLIFEGRKIELYLYSGKPWRSFTDDEKLRYDRIHGVLICLMYVPRSLEDRIEYLLEIFREVYEEDICLLYGELNVKANVKLNSKTTIVYKEEDIF